MLLPAVVAAFQQPLLLEKALELSNTTSSLPLMTPIATCELYNLHIDLALSNESVPLRVSEQYSFHTVPLGSKSTSTRSRSSPFRKLIDIPGSMEAMFSHVGGGAVLGLFSRIWKLCWATLGQPLPLIDLISAYLCSC